MKYLFRTDQIEISQNSRSEYQTSKYQFYNRREKAAKEAAEKTKQVSADWERQLRKRKSQTTELLKDFKERIHVKKAKGSSVTYSGGPNLLCRMWWLDEKPAITDCDKTFPEPAKTLVYQEPSLSMDCILIHPNIWGPCRQCNLLVRVTEARLWRRDSNLFVYHPDCFENS